MKESIFIKKNLDTWKEYENIEASKEKMPQKLSGLFIKITDDLSYAYTYYNNRSVRVYLNGVARRLFNGINHSERFRFSSIKKFYSDTVPLAIYGARKEFLIACIVFGLAMIIGILSSRNDPDFARLILGEDYITMTQTNIAEDDPMAVYKSQAPFDMFFAITINNCLVALKTFVFGFLLAIGTLLILLYNGIMVGSFQYFFVEQNLFQESFLTIWQHGVFEISSIIMSGAAGLVLGKGIVFPGNFTRFQSLRISARRGLKIFLGLIPILIIAAFIEGFYTRYTDAPVFLRTITILISTGLIVGYFIILPNRKGRENAGIMVEDTKIEVVSSQKFETERIYSEQELFMHTFQLLRMHVWKIMRWVLIISLSFAVFLFAADSLDLARVYTGTTSFQAFTILSKSPVCILILFLGFSILSQLMLNLKAVDGEIGDLANQNSFAQFLRVAVLLGTAHLALLIPSPFFGTLLFTILMAYFILVITILRSDNVKLLSALRHCAHYLKGNFPKYFYLSLRYLVLVALFYLVFVKLIAVLNNELIQINLYGSGETSEKIIFYVNAFYFAFIALFAFSFFTIGMKLLYYSLYESVHAKNLLSRIEKMGKTNRVGGLIRE